MLFYQFISKFHLGKTGLTGLAQNWFDLFWVKESTNLKMDLKFGLEERFNQKEIS